MEEVARSFDHLIARTNALTSTLISCRLEVLTALAPDTPLRHGCSTHAALAEELFREVRKKIDDVQRAANTVEDALGRISEK